MSALFELLEAQPADRPAILAPGRPATSYGALVEQVGSTRAQLAGRVAIVLPNGPELAVAFVSAVCGGGCAPLAPDQPQAQFERELATLGARAVVVMEGHDTAARPAAAAVGLPLVELTPGASAGTFTLSEAVDAAGPTDAALLLFTSGTTSTPKLVPLTEDNLLRSAANVAATLALTPDDRCLNVMPLSHIHGLVAALLGSLTAGGSIVCTPGFRAGEVLGWIEELRPSWYTAVPTIHQAMLDAARGADRRGVFRFIRSSSAALPVRVMEELESLFGAPVIEAYGMTEAAHQMTSNPLPPRTRKPGTVGLPAGVEVAILSEAGEQLARGATGEVGIRGPSVMAGYVDNPAANAAAFVDGWFRTGDQGRLDDDGYLSITGRLKEIINRGGEKVAPREIDDVLLEHPDVVHALAFAVPHPRLGEEPAAAVVLRPGGTVTAAELRVFLGHRLAPYKVPRRVVVVDEIPRGRTGKLERRTMAERLGLGVDAPVEPAVPPADDTERDVAAVWQRVLGLDIPPSVTADFFDLGGDSLHATELLVEIDAAFGRRLEGTVFFTDATVREMAKALTAPPPAHEGASVIAVQPDGSRPPLFCLMRGGAIVTARHFARTLGPDQPILGLWAPTMHSHPDAAGSVEDIAAACVEAMVEFKPADSYVLFGHSLGGIVMFEVARQLDAKGHRVELVVLADAVHPTIVQQEWERRHSWRYRLRKLFSRRAPAIIEFRVRRLLGREKPRPKVFVPGTDVELDWAAASARERAYVPGPAPAPVALLATNRYLRLGGGPDLGWSALLGRWRWQEVPGTHDTMIGEPHVHVLAARLGEAIEWARSDVTVGSGEP